MSAPRPLPRRAFLGTGLSLAAAGLAARAAEPKAEPKPDAPAGWLIGCYTRPWDQHEVGVALDAIAEAGYKHAGLMTTKSKSHLVISAETTPEEAQRIGEDVRKRGMTLPSVYGGGFPVGGPLDAGVAALRRLIDACAAAQAGDLMMGGIGDPKLYEAYYKTIAACCDYAAAKGIGISVKPHGGLNGTGPLCRKAIETVGHKNFRLWYDPGNIYYYSDGKVNPVDDAATVDGLVAGMSVKDYQPPKEVMVTPGTGQVDFPKVLARLKQGGFTGGPLVVECLTRGDLPTLLAEARKARQFLEELVAKLA
jgi:sugar phosphate isomerase/epimerase